MTGSDEPKTLTFRCPAGLQDILPPPLPAALGLPDWLKAMPSQAYNVVNAITGDTIKRCPPFVDAMTNGFLIPLICDVRVENGEFSWDNELPPGGEVIMCARPRRRLAQLVERLLAPPGCRQGKRKQGFDLRIGRALRGALQHNHRLGSAILDQQRAPEDPGGSDIVAIRLQDLRRQPLSLVRLLHAQRHERVRQHLMAGDRTDMEEGADCCDTGRNIMKSKSRTNGHRAHSRLPHYLDMIGLQTVLAAPHHHGKRALEVAHIG
jgi:hypothetical protein